MSNKKKQWIFIFSLFSPYPNNKGSSIRIATLIKYLKNHFNIGLFLGYYTQHDDALQKEVDLFVNGKAVHIPSSHFKNIRDTKAKILKARIPVSFDDQFYKNLNNPITDIKIENVQLIESYIKKLKPISLLTEYITSIEPFRYFSKKYGITLISDLLDIQTVRYERLKNSNRDAINEMGATKQKECDLINQLDLAITIQENEELWVRTNCANDLDVLTVRHPNKVSNNYLENSEKKVLFFGSSASHNLEAIEEFLKKSFSYCVNNIPGFRLVIAGTICHNLQTTLATNQHIILHGEVSTPSEAYKLAQVFINPITFGSGLKIKNVEAITNGIPLITTPIGAEGLEDFADLLVITEVDNFGPHIKSLLENKVKRRMVNTALLSRSKEHFSEVETFSQLRRFLTKQASKAIDIDPTRTC